MRQKINRLPQIIAAVVVTAAMCVIAPVSVSLSFTPVPLSMGTFMAYLAAALLGPIWGGGCVLAYLLLGICALPVFAGGQGGWGVLSGPAGGYLFGMLVLALCAGFLIQRKQFAFHRYFLAMLSGAVPYYLIGVLRLSSVLDIGLGRGFALGVRPFLLFELIKIAAAGLIGYFLRTNIRPLYFSKR